MIGGRQNLLAVLIIAAALLGFGRPVLASLDLGPEEIVQAAGADLTVLGYSVPSLVDWNNDGRPDLVVGEGGGGYPEGKVCVFLNEGTPGTPAFSTFFYAQAGGGDLIEPASGCLGLFPRLLYWDADARKDLLIGTSLGNVRLYLNTGTDADPSFDAGTSLQVGQPGLKVDIDVGSRATPIVVDWNSDGRRDLVVGAYDGRIHLFLNEGTDTEPDYLAETFAQEFAADLVVPAYRSSPVVRDLDDDGKKDLLTGNTEGRVLLYPNLGSNAAPQFGGYVPVLADGVPIDLPGTPRSRPFVCDWTGDGRLDLLIGAGDGRVHLFQGQPAISVPPAAAAVCRLLAPWPNPFNPRVNISFQVEQEMPISLAVFDLTGHRVRQLDRRSFAPGTHDLGWNGRDAQGRALPGGVYLVRLQAPGFSATRKVVLAR